LSDTNISLTILSNIMIGSFTLGAALGTVWLKDHLENKKDSQKTLRQKAIEAYAIADKLIHCLIITTIICEYLLEDKNFNYTELQKNNPDTSNEILGQLEINILENFYDLKPQFDVVNKLLTTQKRYLWGIISDIHKKGFSHEKSDFDALTKDYQNNIIYATQDLKAALNEKYINNQREKGCISLPAIFECIKRFFCGSRK